MVCVEHERSSFWLAARHRRQSFILLRQRNLHINLFQIRFGHRLRPSTETSSPRGETTEIGKPPVHKIESLILQKNPPVTSQTGDSQEESQRQSIELRRIRR